MSKITGSYKVVVEFIFDAKELQESHLVRIENEGPVFENDEDNIAAAVAFDLQTILYDHGGMHGHFNVAHVAQQSSAEVEDWWASQDRVNGARLDPAKEVESIIAMFGQSSYRSSYEGRILDKLRRLQKTLTNEREEN
jgi:hypothetical protein